MMMTGLLRPIKNMGLAIAREIVSLSPAIFFAALLSGCASSDVSRGAANQFNTAVQNGGSAFNGVGNGSIGNAYQNSSQTTKGIVVGGVTGAVVGGLSSGIGVLPGTASGAIFGGALGAYIDSRTSLRDKLENRGNKVIVLGDQVLIVLPSNQIFNAMTPELSPYAYSTLNLVTELISGYPNMSVKVAAYTNDAGSERINRSLSQQQAEAIVRYLWRQKINTRLLYAAGYGSSKPVSKSTDDWNQGENYRIEITLEKLPV